MHRQTRLSGSSSRRALCIWAAALAFASGPALAQPTQPLPPELSTALQIGPAQSEQLAAFVKANAAELTGSDRERARAARSLLLEPLRVDGVSVAFRLQYATLVLPIAEGMVRGADEAQTIAGLHMAGELATEGAARLAGERLGDDRQAVRFAAAAALNRTLQALERSAPAMSPAQATAVVRLIAGRLANEKDAHVGDTLIRGLSSGTRLAQKPEFADTAANAFALLCDGASAMVRSAASPTPDADRLAAFIRAGSVVRDALTGPAARSLPRDSVIKAAGLGGDLLAHAARIVAGGSLGNVPEGATPEASAPVLARRALVIQCAAVGETVVYFARSVVDPSAPQTRLSDLLKSGSVRDDASFGVEVKSLIGPEGALVKPPLSLPGDRFKI